jgi:hypothetical protein
MYKLKFFFASYNAKYFRFFYLLPNNIFIKTRQTMITTTILYYFNIHD